MDNQISKLKLYLFILGFAFLVQIVFSAFFFRNSNTLHSSSLTRIDSLITEIGDIKNENLILTQEIQTQKQLNELNDKFLTQLTSDIETKLTSSQALRENVENYKNYLENERNRLVYQNKELTNLLDNSSKTIDELKSENDIQNSFNDLQDNLYVLLLIGENKSLTDTILLVIANEDSQQVTFISIPRDLYYEGRKINEFSSLYGKDKLKEAMHKIAGVTVDNYVEFNFNGFVDTIDLIGGIDINISKDLVDTRYPNENFGYKTVSFKPGIERMDGERALEYGRSRKSTTDFDRSRRQQEILLAIKEKLKQKPPLENVNFYISSFRMVQENIDTDLNILDAVKYYDKFKNYNIKAGNVLSNENFLYSSTSSIGQSILLPKTGNYFEFQRKLLEII